MAKTRQEKQKILEELIQKLKEQKSLVIADFSGVKSDSLFNFRNNIKEKGCFLKVIKKTLFQKALEKIEKQEIAKKIEEIKGQMAVVFGLEDEVLPAKLSYNFSKGDENFKILAGVFNGEFLEKERVIEIAKLPSREELLSSLIGTLKGPIYGFNNVLKANLRNFVYILSEKSKS